MYLKNILLFLTSSAPFANACGAVVDTNSTRELGYDLAKAIREYLEYYYVFVIR